MTLRGAGASGASALDALIAAQELQQAEAKMWKPKFALADHVDVKWSEDGIWYAASIDAVDIASQTYSVTFTEYGNSESAVAESNVKESVAKRYETASVQLSSKPTVFVAQTARGVKSSRDPSPSRRRASSGTKSMAAAFDDLIGGEETRSFLSQFNDVDFSGMETLPALPREPPPLSAKTEYKTWMKLKYEHQNRSVESPLVVEQPPAMHLDLEKPLKDQRASKDSKSLKESKSSKDSKALKESKSSRDSPKEHRRRISFGRLAKNDDLSANLGPPPPASEKTHEESPRRFSKKSSWKK